MPKNNGVALWEHVLVHIDCKAVEAGPINPKGLLHGLQCFVSDLDHSLRAWLFQTCYTHTVEPYAVSH